MRTSYSIGRTVEKAVWAAFYPALLLLLTNLEDVLKGQFSAVWWLPLALAAITVVANVIHQRAPKT